MEMIRRKVPSVLIVSNVFLNMAKGEAKAFGYSELPVLIFPHPLGVKTNEEVQHLAEEKAEELLKACAEGRI